MKVPSNIKWTRSDYIRLGKAVADFNKKLNRIKTVENELYLPETINYKTEKENILTRQQLNSYIKSLRRFMLEGAENLYKTQSGEQLTEWERKEIQYKTSVITRRINKRKKELSIPKTGQEYSRVQMGSIEFRELEAYHKKISDFENRKGYRFQDLRKQIQYQGRADYIYKKQYIFKENYMQVLQRYSHFDNYNKLIDFINNNLQNPKKFYEYVSQFELIGDLTLQSDQYLSQQMFNSFVEDFGITLDFDSIS